MDIDKEILEYLKLNLYKGCLESFGVKQQFIELEFSNSKFEEIKFFIDCQISTSDPEAKKSISALKELDKDTFEIGYFLKANLKLISDCDFDAAGNFRIDFENGYRIVFDLSTNDDANLSITFREKESSRTYRTVDIMSDGITKIN